MKKNAHLLLGGFGGDFAQDDRVSLLFDAGLDAVRSDGAHSRVLDTLGDQSRVRGELLDLVELRDYRHGDAHLRVHLGDQEAVRLQVLLREVELDLCCCAGTVSEWVECMQAHTVSWFGLPGGGGGGGKGGGGGGHGGTSRDHTSKRAGAHGGRGAGERRV